MSTLYLHTIGDSIFDNFNWTKAKEKSVEGLLQEKLNEEPFGFGCEVVSHAYDGFTTKEVLSGGNIGRVLGIETTSPSSLEQVAYLNNKNIEKRDRLLVYPLKKLEQFISEHKGKHYVVISVGGNDFREKLRNPIAMVKEISNVQKRYLQILDKVTSLKDKNVRPILMFQYRLDTNNDEVYGIYSMLKKIGTFFSAIQCFSLLGLGASAMALVAKKVQQRLGIASLLISAGAFALSQQVIPFKVTKGVLLGGQKMGIAALGGFMERFYRPILAQAKKDGIPILDLPNTFNPNNSDLYISQIEPSEEGGKLIAEGLVYIIKHHYFNSASEYDYFKSKSKLYSKKETDIKFKEVVNPGYRGWSVDYPQTATS